MRQGTVLGQMGILKVEKEIDEPKSSLMMKCDECRKIFDRGHSRGPRYCFDCDSKKSRHNAVYWKRG